MSLLARLDLGLSRAGWPRRASAARAAGDAQGDAREPAAWEPSGAAPERAPRPRWRERISARLQDGPRRHRVEAARLALPLRPVANAGGLSCAHRARPPEAL